MGISSFIETQSKSLVLGYFFKLCALILLMPLGGAALVIYQATQVLPNLPPPVPSVIDCENLIRFGAIDNTYLVVTDFRFDTTQMCTNLTGTKSEWREAFIPLESSVGPSVERPVQVVLYTEEALTRADLEALVAENELHGLAIRGTKDFTLTQEIQLAGRYKGVNTSDCLFIRHEVMPPTKLSTYLLIALGTFMMMLGFPLWAFVYWLQMPERPVVAEIVE